MILVVGATGHLGSEICRRLRERGADVRGLVRDTSDSAVVERLHSLGVATVTGDIRDLSSLQSACRGVRTVISTASATRSRQPGDGIEETDGAGQLNVVDAARDAGVKRFVYVSYSANLDDDGPLTRAKRAAEERVRESGMDWTILRPSFFMEAWLSPALGFDYVNGAVTYYGSGTAPVSFISLGDVAEFAVRAALDGAGSGEALELGGPEPVSLERARRIFEEATGRTFEVKRVPEEALRTQYESATDPLARSFAALMLDLAKGDVVPMDDTLRRIPVSLRSVREYAQAVLAPG